MNSEAGICRTFLCGLSANEGKLNRLSVALERVLWAAAVTVNVSTIAADPRKG